MTRHVISFLYHEVTDNPKISGFQVVGALPYIHKVSHFLSDLDLILKHFKKSESVINLSSLKDMLNLILTFDDGGSSAVSIAKILSDKGLVGHFFITTSMIGADTFLNTDQIKNIRKMGHVIGTHSHTHPSIFRDLSYDQKIDEWGKSKKILEDILGEKISTASIPGGDMDDDTIRAAGDVGIEFLFTSEPSYRPYEKFGVLVFGRVCPKNTTAASQINQWAQGKGFLKSLLIRKAKNFMRISLKPLYSVFVKKGKSTL